MTSSAAATGPAATGAAAAVAAAAVAGGDLLLVVAPHYDDAAFSVGGLVHAHVRSGGRAKVVTVFGGAPASETDAASPLAQALHERWASAGAATPSERGQGDGGALATACAIVDLRRLEDAAALRWLGAEQHALEFPDCIYRRVGGTWRCAAEADLFASDGPDEPDLCGAVAGAIASLGQGASLVLAPLGLGRHVDHTLAHIAAAPLPNVGYYEDIPYSLRPAGWARRRVLGLTPFGWPLEEVDLDAKERACLAYASQWPTFWPDQATLAAELRQAARSGWSPGVWCETVWLAPTAQFGRSLLVGSFLAGEPAEGDT